MIANDCYLTKYLLSPQRGSNSTEKPTSAIISSITCSALKDNYY